MIKRGKIVLLIQVICVVNIEIYAQQLDPGSKIKLVLCDGTELHLLSAINTQGNDYLYYYLPSNLRISVSNNKPEISLIVYDDAGNSGGLLHFLLTWGLNPSQEREANKLLKEKVNENAQIAGQVLVNEAVPGISVTSNKPIASILRESFNRNSHIPLISGTKYATSLKLNADQVQEFLNAKKNYNNTKDITIRMSFTYNEMVQEGFVQMATIQEWIIEMPVTELVKFL